MNYKRLIISLALPQLAGFIGSLFTTPAITGWYAGLVKPSFNPPNWIFAPVWTTLFVLMGISFYLVWNKGLKDKASKTAVVIFSVQLALNTFWSIIFFGLHNPGAAFVEIIFLWIAIIATIIAFAKISKPAAWLLAPYILWVSFAAILNFSILVINNYQIQKENTIPGPTPISQVSYLCDDRKTINASYYKGKPVAQSLPGEPPVPTGSVYLILSDGRKLTLPQTISGSGIRYTNSGESIIFWSKGNGVFMEENNIQTYANCIALAPDAGGLSEAYVDGVKGFSIRYPQGYILDDSYKYQELGQGKDDSGIKFIIPASITQGTNLSSFDTGVSVEEIPDIQECGANLFVYPPGNVALIDDNGVSYSVAESNGAGAGNFYEEKVWAIPGTNPCVAVRYFIHSTNIGNYTPGAVKEFDRQALLGQFDQIRRSLIINQ